MQFADAFVSVPSQKPKILIVDDQIENIQLLHLLLEDNYDIFMATDGEQGIKQCRKHMPDLVLLDIVMSGLDGYHTCRILKEDILTRHIPIIFVTGHDDNEEVKGFELGVSDYIRKPISPIILEKKIDIHLTLKRQNECLSYLSRHDDVTGIANRYSFFNILQELWAECENKNEPLSIIMLDVDDFKSFNYKYGHVMGDTVLKMIADIFQEYIQQPNSLVARYGGGEFCCLLPCIHLGHAVEIAQALRLRIENLHMNTAALNLSPITASLGVTSTIPGQIIAASRLLLSEVNDCLYLAKKSGKNSIKYTEK